MAVDEEEVRNQDRNYGNRTKVGHMDLILATWNVQTLNGPGKLRTLTRVLSERRIRIAAVQETKWASGTVHSSRSHTIFTSSENPAGGFLSGTAFLVDKVIQGCIVGFTPVDHRLCVLRVRGRFFQLLPHKRPRPDQYFR
jgi:hypothetical protein